MNFKSIKVIASDIDGTLLNDNQEITLNTINAIKKIKAKGMLFGLCSGKETNSIFRLIQECKIKDYVDFVISHWGAEVHDYLLKQAKSTFLLDHHIMLEIVNHFQDMKVNFAIPDPENGILYATKLDEYVNYLSRPNFVPCKIENLNKFLNKPMNRIILICDPSYMPLVIERSVTFKSNIYQRVPGLNQTFLLEYLHQDVCKSKALDLFLKDHHFIFDCVCAFGDGTNDIDLISRAKIGVAMSNGVIATKVAADFITDDNNHDGVANFINSHW